MSLPLRSRLPADSHPGYVAAPYRKRNPKVRIPRPRETGWLLRARASTTAAGTSPLISRSIALAFTSLNWTSAAPAAISAALRVTRGGLLLGDRDVLVQVGQRMISGRVGTTRPDCPDHRPMRTRPFRSPWPAGSHSGGRGSAVASSVTGGGKRLGLGLEQASWIWAPRQAAAM